LNTPADTARCPHPGADDLVRRGAAAVRVELVVDRALLAVGRRVVVLGGAVVVVVVAGVITTGVAAGAGLVAATGVEAGAVEALRL
jgi:hypothetical protein